MRTRNDVNEDNSTDHEADVTWQGGSSLNRRTTSGTRVHEPAIISRKTKDEGLTHKLTSLTLLCLSVCYKRPEMGTFWLTAFLMLHINMFYGPAMRTYQAATHLFATA